MCVFPIRSLTPGILPPEPVLNMAVGMQPPSGPRPGPQGLLEGRALGRRREAVSASQPARGQQSCRRGHRVAGLRDQVEKLESPSSVTQKHRGEHRRGNGAPHVVASPGWKALAA